MTPYLYSHENFHAPERANGRNFWGHPARRGGLSAIRLIVIHTAENVPDLRPPDTGAEAVARFQAHTDRPSSYHRIVDSDSTKLMLPDEAVAFGARGANTPALHLSFATYARLWTSLPSWWIDAALGRGAEVARQWAATYRIPIVRLSRSGWRSQRGFVAHGDIDPDRRSDPGRSFPWARFLDLVRHDQEDVMTPAQEAKLDEALGLLRELRAGKMADRQMADDSRRVRIAVRKVLGHFKLPNDVKQDGV